MPVALAQELGGIDRVELGELPAPTPAAEQALVRVYGAGAGPWDTGFLSGGFPGLALPFVPGQEVAGVVEAAGLVIGGGTAHEGLVDRGRPAGRGGASVG
jgi:NADPH:quinone reductase-like Zn-dependent oxidoreductase